MYKVLKQHKSFGGQTIFCEHESRATQTVMRFSVFLPAEISKIDSAIIWLSGLTCSEENFITKAGSQAHLVGTTTMIICPDTSPRNLGLIGEDDAYDFGSGASFYLNATLEPYATNYRMEDYIVQDIVQLLKTAFGVEKISLCGHSMGGHGALVLGLKNPTLFEFISAFSPIVNPMVSPWGLKAFNGYLGEDTEAWKAYDACELLKKGFKSPFKILIDQGTQDEFLIEQLHTGNFQYIAEQMGQSYEIRYREGYDHSYYFVATFLKNHLQAHLEYLRC